MVPTTEQRPQQEFLKLFAAISETTADFLYAFDLDGRIVYANRRLLEVWGRLLEDAVGKNLYELGYPTWHADMHVRELRQVIETKQAIKGEVPFTGGSGISGVYEYIFNPVLGRDGQVELITGTTRDVTDRKRANDRAHSILESISDAFFALDEEWRFTYVNQQAERVLARDAGDLLGKIIWGEYQIIGTDFERAYRKAASEREAQSFTSYYPGHDRWYEVHAYPADTGISVYFRDVTGRRRIEEALRTSEERFRGAFDQSVVGIVLSDLDGRIELVNPAFCRLVGREQEELVGHTSRSFTHPEDVGQNVDVIGRLKAQSSPSNVYEKRYVRPDGVITCAQVSLSPVRDATGAPVGLIAVVEDVTERKRAVAEREALFKKLEEQTQFLDTALSSISDYTYTLDREGRFRFANKPLLDLWGLTLEEAVGKTFFDLGYPTALAERLHRQVKEVFDTKGKASGETEYTSPTGEHGYFEYTFAPVLAPDGSVELVAGVTRVITGRKEAEALAAAAKLAAEASLARWQAVVASMAEGVVLADREGNLLEWNAAALRMHGYDSADDVRKNLSQIASAFELTQADGTVVPVDQWPIPRALRGETFSNCELRVRRVDGPLDLVVSYSGTPLRDRDGGVSLVVLTLHDVTEERNAQRAVREGEAHFRDTFEQSPIGMTVNDLGGRYVHVNPAYCHLVGYTREELLDPAFDLPTLAHPDDRPKMVELQRQLLAGELPSFFLEKRYVRRDGSTVWVRVTGTLRKDAAGKPSQFIRLVEDIDERKRAEGEREQLLQSERTARSDAERASRMKDEFLATLSHELRTPLNAILGWSQILERGSRSPADLGEGLATISRNARAQTQIIEDLLDMSRIVSGKLRLDVQRTDLAAIVRAAVETVRPAADAKSLRLQAVLDPLAGPVSGDPNRLQQVFWNLLTNAVKFTPKGGRVQVLLERVNSHLEASVIDTGEGIKPEFLPHVFDRFRQEDGGTTRRHGGLGLGLSIVKQLVELHGGSVRAKSGGPGQGTTFTVALPVTVIHPEPGSEPERRHPKAPDSTTLLPDICVQVEGVRVLVVDDEPDARALVKRFLEDCKAVVTTAASAEDAMGYLRSERFDVLVSDIGMAGEDGYSLVRRVRALGRELGGDIPAVALTAYARAEDRMKAMVAGFQQHVVKPVEPAELITVVAVLAGRTTP
jgi:PAS domain S-box-containing protein